MHCVKTRLCSKSGCGRPATATLTFAYADQQAVLGPLATRHEPAAYDLCVEHSRKLSAPRGWELIRLPDAAPEPEEHDSDDLQALADAVRRVGLAHDEPYRAGMYAARADVEEVAHRGHLTVLTDASNTRRARRGDERRDTDRRGRDED